MKDLVVVNANAMKSCSLRYPSAYVSVPYFYYICHVMTFIFLTFILLHAQVLGADMAILDEIDSGLDVDALRDVASAVNKILTPENSLLMITHYRRILDLLNPTHVHVMVSYK